MSYAFGWQPSLLLQDLSTGTQAGAMNIHMNQALADMQARSTLYMTPTMSWNSFIPYGVPNGGMDYLIDPKYTIGQWQWNQNNQNSIWGGGFCMPQMNWNNPFNNPWNPSINNNNNTPSANNKTEKSFQTKYQKLEKLVKALISEDSPLKGSRKDELKSVLSAREGKTWKEKFENLKEAYNEIPKEDVKEFLVTEAACTLSVNGKDVKKNSFYQKLQNVGYEFKNSEVDKEILPLHEALSNLKGDSANAGHDGILGNLASNTGTYDILDVISSWNNTYKNENIIQCFAKQYAKMNDETSKSTAVQSALIPIVNALLTQARDLQNGLDSASKEKMTKSIDAVNKAIEGTINFTDLSKAFDNLYLQTRLAAVDSLRAEIQDYYGTIDSEVFNDKLFEDATIKDLKEEGFIDSKINEAKVKAKVSRDVVREEKYNDGEKTATEHVEAMIKDGYLGTATAKGIGGKVYYDKNTHKVYVIKKNEDDEEEIHEVIDAKADTNGNVTVKGSVETKAVTASEIAAESDKAKEDAASRSKRVEAAEKLCKKQNILKKNGQWYQETNGEHRNFKLEDGMFVEIKKNHEGNYEEGDSYTPEEIEAAHEEAETQAEKIAQASTDGADVYNKIFGPTDDRDYESINTALTGLNKDTVMDFVQSYYDKQHWFNFEGIIEALDDENDGDKITMDAKKNLINSFLEKAKELNLENDPDYKAIQNIMNSYDSGKIYQDEKTFNVGNGGFKGIGGGWSDLISNLNPFPILEDVGTIAAIFGAEKAVKTAAGRAAGTALARPGAGAAGTGAATRATMAARAITKHIPKFITNIATKHPLALAAVAIGLVADRQTDNEVIDRHMKSLLEKMQAKIQKK